MRPLPLLSAASSPDSHVSRAHVNNPWPQSFLSPGIALRLESFPVRGKVLLAGRQIRRSLLPYSSCEGRGMRSEALLQKRVGGVARGVRFRSGREAATCVAAKAARVFHTGKCNMHPRPDRLRLRRSRLFSPQFCNRARNETGFSFLQNHSNVRKDCSR